MHNITIVPKVHKAEMPFNQTNDINRNATNQKEISGNVMQVINIHVFKFYTSGLTLKYASWMKATVVS